MNNKSELLIFGDNIVSYIFLTLLIVILNVMLIPLYILCFVFFHQNERRENHIQRLKLLRGDYE